MAFPLGLLLTWLGVAGLWVAFHRTGATTPWGVYQEILGQGQDVAPTADTSDGTKPATSDPAQSGTGDPAAAGYTPSTDPTLGNIANGLIGPHGLFTGGLSGFGQPAGSGGVFYPNGQGQ